MCNRGKLQRALLSSSLVELPTLTDSRITNISTLPPQHGQSSLHILQLLGNVSYKRSHAALMLWSFSSNTTFNLSLIKVNQSTNHWASGDALIFQECAWSVTAGEIKVKQSRKPTKARCWPANSCSMPPSRVWSLLNPQTVKKCKVYRGVWV